MLVKITSTNICGSDLHMYEGRTGMEPGRILGHENLGIVIAVPMTTARRPWATRVEVAEGSFAIAEQPRTFSVDRITKVEPIGYDVGPVVRVIAILLGS